ncbi:MAG: methyltransferase domain-containing protein [Bryobacterales bacterium]|nr:methyltransferase domain-containing protein [Bryobacterales bacterium]
MGAEDGGDIRAEELAAVIQEIRGRVRARYPGTSIAPYQIPLPDLMPLLHARDAAEAKVAAIGSVNPRAGGALNALIQFVKKTVARALDWHVREQVDFNRNTILCVQATLEALGAMNHTLALLAERMNAEMETVRIEREQERVNSAAILAELRREFAVRLDQFERAIDPLRSQIEELKDMRAHWVEWRQGWERKLELNEIQFLRSVADLQGAFQHRATLMEANFRDIVKSQHADYLGALDRSGDALQKLLWGEAAKSRVEFEKLIHLELRLIRQRSAAAHEAPVPPVSSAAPAIATREAFDYGRFAERFRGGEEYVRERQRFYVPYFAACGEVLDIGCGRGEFLELMREAGVHARGIDLSGESVTVCVGKGLAAAQEDLFPYLESLPDASLDGIFSSQVVEHIEPERLPEMIRLAAAKLARGGVLALETPNPACLAIFATHFYLDPTHHKPIPQALLSFYMEEFGLGGVEVHKLSPAMESMPALASLPEDFREAFFGGLDYAIIGRKLA